MYLVLASLCCSVLLCLFQGGAAIADPLMGDVAAANPSLSAVASNPAAAAFLDRTQVAWSPELFKSETIYARYPGFESASLADNGVGSLLSMPAFVYKPNSRLSIGGYAVPALPIKINIKKENLPVMLLGTLNYVDLLAKGGLKGAGQALVGYRISNSLGIGFNANYQSVGFTAELIPSDGGSSLADITGSFTTITTNLGFRYEISSKLAVGLSFGLFSQKNTDLKIDSPLLDQGGGGAAPGGGSGSGGGSITSPADNFLVGIEASLSPQSRFLLDLQYARANKGEETFSLVDLTNKKRDVYDTLAVRAGMSLGLTPTNSALVGYRYEPSNLGPGSPGPEGTAGFGTIDLVTMFAGFETLRPYSQYSVGLKMLAGWVAERAERSPKKRAAEVKEKGFHAWEVSFGLVYRLASLGIDENGELPGAYLQKKVFIPVTVLRKF